MSLSFEEIVAGQRTQRAQMAEQRTRQLRERQAVGQKISELIADPRWEVFGRYLEQIFAVYDSQASSANNDLLNKVLTPEEYVAVKIKQVKAASGAAAIEQVKRLAKTLIEQGEEALKELKLTSGTEKE